MTFATNRNKMELMEIKDFFWNEKIIIHIARHKVTPDEVEEVAFDNDPYIRKGKKKIRYMLGQTLTGRYLFIVYILNEKNIVEIITARDMDKAEKRYYKKRGGK